MNGFWRYGLTSAFLLGSMYLYGQSGSRRTDLGDSISAVNPGKFSGQLRYYFMATDNRPPFTDYYAHALSIQGKYETGRWKGFSLAAGAAAYVNLGSSDLKKVDPVAGRPSRYEVGLFDLRDPNQKVGFRPEELYLQYTSGKGFFRVGSQLISTPFINPQDGRMRPNFVGGIYTKQVFPKVELEGGWIGAMLPRSINGWYKVGSSVGLNPQGVNTDGTAANYAGHLSSKGIFLAGVGYSMEPRIKVSVWEQFVANLFNTALLQLDGTETLNSKIRYLISIQYIHQAKVAKGGSSESSKGYFQSSNQVHVLGGMTGIKSPCFEASFNYTRIFGTARFLMPREWGREPFFTFMPRERVEGYGDVHAFVIKMTYRFPETGLKTSLQAGRFRLPGVRNTVLNKYGMPSYDQLNAEVRYSPPFAPKLDVQALYVHKTGKGDPNLGPGYIFNKVNMSLYSLVLNYTW